MSLPLPTPSSTSQSDSGAPFELSGLLIRPIAQRVADWVADGKLDEDDLDRALSPDARAWLDHAIAASDWGGLADVEGLIAILSTQLGGETGLVEWADQLVDELRADPVFDALSSSGRRLVDGAGFIASQASERLIRECGWQYEGNREGFSVRLAGVGKASPALKALLGACLARLAASASGRNFDVRFHGVDGRELVIFGEEEAARNPQAESRLHRAALIP